MTTHVSFYAGGQDSFVFTIGEYTIAVYSGSQPHQPATPPPAPTPIPHIPIPSLTPVPLAAFIAEGDESKVIASQGPTGGILRLVVPEEELTSSGFPMDTLLEVLSSDTTPTIFDLQIELLSDSGRGPSDG